MSEGIILSIVGIVAIVAMVVVVVAIIFGRRVLFEFTPGGDVRFMVEAETTS